MSRGFWQRSRPATPRSLRRVGGDQPQDRNGRGHFYSAAAEAMRWILIYQARRKQADGHGDGWHRLDVMEAELDVDSAVTITWPSTKP